MWGRRRGSATKDDKETLSEFVRVGVTVEEGVLVRVFEGVIEAVRDGVTCCHWCRSNERDGETEKVLVDDNEVEAVRVTEGVDERSNSLEFEWGESHLVS